MPKERDSHWSCSIQKLNPDKDIMALVWVRLSKRVPMYEEARLETCSEAAV